MWCGSEKNVTVAQLERVVSCLCVAPVIVVAEVRCLLAGSIWSRVECVAVRVLVMERQQQ